MRAAVGKKAVGETEGGAIADFVAVALVLVLVVESFCVGEVDVRALAAGDSEKRIGGGEGLAVEENVDVAAGRDGDCAGREAAKLCEVRAHNFTRAGG